MAGINDCPEYVAGIHVGVNAVHVYAGDHHLADYGVAELKDFDEHFLFLRIEHALLFA